MYKQYNKYGYCCDWCDGYGDCCEGYCECDEYGDSKNFGFVPVNIH